MPRATHNSNSNSDDRQPHRPTSPPRQLERRRQVRGLLFLALIAIAFAILRAGVHRVFTVGWWRLW